ncbi:MAG TPA: hypothetical protein VNP04_21450 [Alphaproteobacteria bacterium]|nr:hypothetical protein [Alphaproteobacteria bacterium]
MIAITAEERLAQLRQHVAQLRRACQAVLLFHDGTPWTPQKQAAWEQFTQMPVATTRALCDTVRQALSATTEDLP